MGNQSFDDQFQRELDMAVAARASGNEGRARVCARRAAGLVVGEYLARQGLTPVKPSAYDRLREIRNLADTPDDVARVIDHLLLRVDQSQQLPIPIDLIEDTLWLKSRLLGIS